MVTCLVTWWKAYWCLLLSVLISHWIWNLKWSVWYPWVPVGTVAVEMPAWWESAKGMNYRTFSFLGRPLGMGMLYNRGTLLPVSMPARADYSPRTSACLCPLNLKTGRILWASPCFAICFSSKESLVASLIPKGLLWILIDCVDVPGSFSGHPLVLLSPNKHIKCDFFALFCYPTDSCTHVVIWAHCHPLPLWEGTSRETDTTGISL